MATSYDNRTGDVLLDDLEVARFLLLENEYEEVEFSATLVGSDRGRNKLGDALRARSSGRPPRGHFNATLRFDDDGTTVRCLIGTFQGFREGRQFFLVSIGSPTPPGTSEPSSLSRAVSS